MVKLKIRMFEEVFDVAKVTVMRLSWQSHEN